MSKGLGRQIAIKFTEDLVGDVTGNVSAFTIEGKERKHIGGIVIDGDYKLDRVEKKGILLLGVTDTDGNVEFILDTETEAIDTEMMQWETRALEYFPAQGTIVKATQGEIIVNVVLEKNLLPDVDGLVLWLDATDVSTFESRRNPIIDTNGLVLYLSADEGVEE